MIVSLADHLDLSVDYNNHILSVTISRKYQKYCCVLGSVVVGNDNTVPPRFLLVRIWRARFQSNSCRHMTMQWLFQSTSLLLINCPWHSLWFRDVFSKPLLVVSNVILYDIHLTSSIIGRTATIVSWLPSFPVWWSTARDANLFPLVEFWWRFEFCSIFLMSTQALMPSYCLALSRNHRSIPTLGHRFVLSSSHRFIYGESPYRFLAEFSVHSLAHRVREGILVFRSSFSGSFFSMSIINKQISVVLVLYYVALIMEAVF